MTDEQTTLSEFDGVGPGVRDDAPTPETNADDIQRLVTLLEGLTEHVGSLADQVGQHDDAGSIDTEPTDATERMFQ